MLISNPLTIGALTHNNILRRFVNENFGFLLHESVFVAKGKYLRGECRTLYFHISYPPPRVSKNYRLYVKRRDHERSLRKLHLYKIFCLQKHVKIG